MHFLAPLTFLGQQKVQGHFQSFALNKAMHLLNIVSEYLALGKIA
jgi:hypothetical protein